MIVIGPPWPQPVLEPMDQEALHPGQEFCQLVDFPDHAAILALHPAVLAGRPADVEFEQWSTTPQTAEGTVSGYSVRTDRVRRVLPEPEFRKLFPCILRGIQT